MRNSSFPLKGDGVVVSGSAKIDESMLTGESTLVEKETGSTVFAGTTVSADGDLKLGSLVIQATGTFEEVKNKVPDFLHQAKLMGL